jgi:hypothetical protein
VTVSVENVNCGLPARLLRSPNGRNLAGGAYAALTPR